MSAFTTSNIPSAITTLEQLSYWAVSFLQGNSGAAARTLTAGENPIPVASINIGTDANGAPIAIMTLVAPIDLTLLNTSSGKAWLSVGAVSTVAAGGTFVSN